MPDRWGRTLLQRRANLLARERGVTPQALYDIDFLLGVQDESRMGALRFKTDPEGLFLDNQHDFPIPPVSSLRELQFAANAIESDAAESSIKKWLSVLLAPGSSLGGARPKANVYDVDRQMWIAKFPSRNDMVDKGAWEYLTYQLAIAAGIQMAPSKLLKISGEHHTFLTQRFDRQLDTRIHFSSAMTMTGKTEEILREEEASYLDLAEFIQFSGARPRQDLAQLWRRIVFNIAVSNTDDHLRNHGFLLSNDGWVLSPAFDLNPSTEKNGLALNIDLHQNDLDFELAFEVGMYFQLDRKEMSTILGEVKNVIKNWEEVAYRMDIPKKEQSLMSSAFRY
ncbi:MAG: HipA domain-containing protein [Bacteroidota bacterium]